MIDDIVLFTRLFRSYRLAARQYADTRETTQVKAVKRIDAWLLIYQICGILCKCVKKQAKKGRQEPCSLGRRAHVVVALLALKPHS